MSEREAGDDDQHDRSGNRRERVPPAQTTCKHHCCRTQQRRYHNWQDAQPRHHHDQGHDGQRPRRPVRMRQVHRAIEHQHVAAVFELRDVLAAPLHENDVTGTQKDIFKITTDCTGHAAGSVNGQGQ